MRAKRTIGMALTGILLALAWLPSLTSSLAGAEWHVSQGVVRFRIEVDERRAVVPDVFMMTIEPLRTNPARIRLEGLNKEANYIWLNHRIYSKGEPMVNDSRVEFKLESVWDRFVGQAGIDDRAEGGAQAVFRIYIDDKLMWESPLMRGGEEPAQVNVKIPSGSKQIRLETEGRGLNRRQIAAWGNAGFTFKGRNSPVSQVEVWPAGFDYQRFDPVVVTVAGREVGCQVLRNSPGQPLSLLFDSSAGSGVYYVYLAGKGTTTRLPWQPRAGLTLETRRAPVIDPKCHDLRGLGEIWHSGAEPVNKTPADRIHHAEPIHGRLDTLEEKEPQQALGLYYYEGFFKVDKPGRYTFATASNWGSYLSVDSTLVVEWPGAHDWRGGHRGQQQGTVLLSPGVHKLEYLNGSPWTTMFTLAAWQYEADAEAKPDLRIMTDADFVPVDNYKTVAVSYAKCQGGMAWRVVRDWRGFTLGRPVVAMEFQMIPAEGRTAGECRWIFDDGVSATGQRVEHLFFRPGLRSVTLEILDGEKKAVATVKGEVMVEPRWEVLCDGENRLGELVTMMGPLDLACYLPGDLAGLFQFGQEMDSVTIRSLAAKALAGQAGQLTGNDQDAALALELASYLKSWEMKNYAAALAIYDALSDPKSIQGKVRQQALLGRAEILIRCQEQPQEGLAALNQVGSIKAVSESLAVQAGLLRAEAQLVTGQYELAKMTLQAAQPAPLSSGDGVIMQSRLRSARTIIATARDPVELQSAADRIEEALLKEPAAMLRPDLGLARIDLCLQRQEYQLADYHARLLGRLDTCEQYRPDILLRQIQALKGLGQMEPARRIYQELAEQYPYSTAVARAREIVGPS